jgi:flotillin
MSATLLLAIAVLALPLLAIGVAFKWLLRLAAPNEVLVLAGARRRMADSSIVGYRAIRGGRAIRIPLLERLDVWDVTGIAIALESVELFTRGDLPLRLTTHAVVRPAAEEPRLRRALECFLGRRREEIAAVAKQVVAGLLPAVARDLTAAQIMLDPARFTEVLRDELEHVFSKLGLELDGLRITVMPDAYGYEKSLSR